MLQGGEEIAPPPLAAAATAAADQHSELGTSASAHSLQPAAAPEQTGAGRDWSQVRQVLQPEQLSSCNFQQK